MVKVVFGLPGSGKSTYAAREASRAIRRGQRVYSNFFIRGAYTLDFERLGLDEYSDCLMILDEVSLFADARNWKQFKPETKYFFVMHRHYNVELLVLSQSYTDMDIRIRNIADELYHITASRFGFSRVRPVSKRLEVVDGRVQEYYEETGLGTFFRRSLYYDLFDSYEKKTLPPNSETLYK